MTDTIVRRLDEYRLLGCTGLRVSPMCLGTVTFGTEWGWGSDAAQARRVLHRFLERGGNFVDTAPNYTDGTSETWLGEFLTGRRDKVVLATKYAQTSLRGDPNAGGTHRKSLRRSVEQSLSRLRTDYIDLLWIHADDDLTPIEEVMRALDDLVRAGKILYIGISNMPAWKIAQGQTVSMIRGWSPVVAIQVEYNLIQRDAERELIPMARANEISVTAWSPLGGGVLTGKYDREPKPTGGAETDSPDASRKRDLSKRLTPRARAIADVTRQVANELNRTPSQVALSWLLAQPSAPIPVIGARLETQLDDNVEALAHELPQEYLRRLSEHSKIELGHPHDFLHDSDIRPFITGGTTILPRDSR